MSSSAPSPALPRTRRRRAGRLPLHVAVAMSVLRARTTPFAAARRAVASDGSRPAATAAGGPRRRDRASASFHRAGRGWIASAFFGRDAPTHRPELAAMRLPRGGASGTFGAASDHSLETRPSDGVGATIMSDVTRSTEGHPPPSTSEKPSAPPPPSPFEYVPVTALDDYGQSKQLRHAMESADRFGTPVLACVCGRDGTKGENNDTATDVGGNRTRAQDAIVVCSLQRPRLGTVAISLPLTGGVTTVSRGNDVHPSIQGMVRIISTCDDSPNIPAGSEGPTHLLHTALVSTGVQADATFLLSRLQAHLSQYWFRYDALPSSAVKMAQDILLDCFDYDREEEVTGSQVSGGIGSAAGRGDQGDEGGGGMRAGRPLGVSSLLLGLDADAAGTVPGLTLVRADGSARRCVAQAMGAGSTRGNVQLSQRWRRDMSREEARELLVGILRDVAEEEGWASVEGDGAGGGTAGGGRKEDGLAVVCETVTAAGIEVEMFSL